MKRKIQALTAGLLCGWVLLLALAAVAPALHEQMHSPDFASAGLCHDSNHHCPDKKQDPYGQAEHQCAITLFAAGVELFQTDSFSAPLETVLDIVSSADSPQPDIVLISLVQARAPPVV